ncbi:hypothetical protein [Chondromyces apiculatus]|uniref:Uncharacterized protein n=1 Tax=Chondromyces apiculatus DSM 436 TaxID=1192034 RepID=A0A017T825_9BACT|nr:hypothetical protein [Chondromyces apiculatus]EYF05097.1 Hypothetical protein CAP_3687 [Chondromyces apiculatus DSM 436]
MTPEAVLSEEELEATRPTWHAVDAVGLVAAVLPALLHFPSRRENRAVLTVGERTIASTHVEETDTFALVGGSLTLVCAFVGLLLFRRFKRSRRPLRLGLALVLVALGAHHIARGAGAFANHDDGPLELIAGPPVSAPPPPPPLPEHARLSDFIRNLFPTLPLTSVSCPPIDATTSRVTCALIPTTGAPVDLTLERAGGEWLIRSPQRIYAAKTLGDELAADLSNKMKTQIVVDCGPGLIPFSGGDKHVCSATRKSSPEPRKVEVTFGKIEVTFGAERGYTWKATAL